MLQRTQVTPSITVVGGSGGGVSGGGAGGAADTEEVTGKGVIPAHYRSQIGIALASDPYRTVKEAALQRLRMGDEDAELDALQILASSVVVRSGVAQPRLWSALTALIADGPKRGIVADLVDQAMAPLTVVARTRSAELLGRTVGYQLSADKATLHEHLRGFRLDALDAGLSPEAWGASVDLGAAYREARACMRGEEAPVSSGQPYSTLEDVEDALQIAEPVLALRGVVGSGEGTLPHALVQVRDSHRLYGGPGATPAVLAKIAEQGSAFTVATLNHIGASRHGTLSLKNPTAPLFDQLQPPHAKQQFSLHVGRLQGSLLMQGYLSYVSPQGADGSSGEGRGGGGRGAEEHADKRCKIAVTTSPRASSTAEGRRAGGRSSVSPS